MLQAVACLLVLGLSRESLADAVLAQASLGAYFKYPIPFGSMPLIPRWRYMGDGAKALTKRTAISVLVVLVVLLVFRALVPWVLLALVAWWSWKLIRK